MPTVNVYLTFPGNCLEAFEFYRSIFGGEFTFAGHFKDMPPMDGMPPLSAKDAERVMHVSLPIGEGTILFGSDTFEKDDATLVKGNNFALQYTADDKSSAKKAFDALAAEGAIITPFDKTFWDSWFGFLTDRYGIRWMVSCPLTEAEKAEKAS